FLPVVPQTTTEEADTATTQKGGKPWQVVVTALFVLLIIAASTSVFWYTRTHSSSTAQPGKATHIAGTPNAKATAAGQAQATVEANQILADPLSHNIHNLPVGQDEFFSGGAYHIQN